MLPHVFLSLLILTLLDSVPCMNGADSQEAEDKGNDLKFNRIQVKSEDYCCKSKQRNGWVLLYFRSPSLPTACSATP